MACNTAFPLRCFPFWCYRVLPLVYSEGLSDYEVICKCIDYVNRLIDSDRELATELEKQGTDIESLKSDVKDIQTELDNISGGKYIEKYLEQMLAAVKTWVDDNLPGIVGNAVKFVQFGLTPSGRFCARIPYQWGFMSFDTIMDATSELYGHLVLQY